MASEIAPTLVSELIESGDLIINDGYRAKNLELSSEGLPFARAQNINNGFHFSGADCFPEEDLNKVGIKISQPGDVVFTSKGTVGRFALVRQNTPQFVYAPQLCFWRSLNHARLYPRWLYYWMQSREFFVQYSGVANQTDMAQYVSLRDQRCMYISIPLFEEQRRIAHILGTLDDKIDLNRRMNRTLEKMTAAIFKSWFIDFDPVHAKAEGQDPGLPDEIADLFPDSFKGSALGPIPKGWKIVELPDAIEVNPTRRIPRGTPSPHVEMKAMPTKLSRPVRWPLRRFSSGSKFKNGDVLLARITPCLENGKTAFVDFLEKGQIGWGSTEYIVMCSQHPLPPEFTYLLARSERLRDYAIANMTGTSGRQRVPASCFDKLPIAIPSEDVARVFGEFMQPVFRKTRANDRQSVRLAKLRDTLLPNLLSGELKVPDAEKDLEDAE